MSKFSKNGLITLHDLYDHYVDKINRKMIDHLQQARKAETSFYIFKNDLLSKYGTIIEISTSLKLTEIDTIDIRRIKHIKYKFGDNFVKADMISFNNALYVLVKLREQVADHKKEADILEKSKVKREVYISINRVFNRTIRDSILDGYSFSMPNRYGSIFISARANRGVVNRVDFNESKKLRAKLISEGHTPFKQWFDEDGNKVNNGGVNWLVFITNKIDYWWHYRRSDSRDFPNKDIYSIKFTNGVNGVCQMLMKHIKRYPNIIDKYQKM